MEEETGAAPKAQEQLDGAPKNIAQEAQNARPRSKASRPAAGSSGSSGAQPNVRSLPEFKVPALPSRLSRPSSSAAPAGPAPSPSQASGVLRPAREHGLDPEICVKREEIPRRSVSLRAESVVNAVARGEGTYDGWNYDEPTSLRRERSEEPSDMGPVAGSSGSSGSSKAQPNGQGSPSENVRSSLETIVLP